MTDAPVDIRRFETLQLIYVFLSLIYGFAAGGAGPFIRIAGAVLMLALSLLVSRGRKNWARWALLLGFALWIMLLGAAAIWLRLVDPDAMPTVPRSYPFAIAIAGLLQGAALFLIFTPQSSSWLRKAASKA